MDDKHETTFQGLRLRQADDQGDGHTLTGIAVPFGQVINTWEGRETFDPDCVFDGADTAKIMWQHDRTTPIGVITKATPTSEGLKIDARISDTQAGRDALTLVRDGVIDSLSIGFQPIEDAYDDAGVTHRRHVRLLETSLVSFPAYSAARITGTRSATTTTTTPTGDKTMTTTADSDETRQLADRIQSVEDRADQQADEIRQLQTAAARGTGAHADHTLGAAWASQGDYLRALATGDTAAADLQTKTRDLIATGDTGNTATWIQDSLRLIQQRRKVAGILTHGSLPATGMTLEYNVVATDTTTAGKQATEGADLAFGKVTFGTKSVDIQTYGGYTTLSRQVIDRSTTPMLNTALTALTNAYAKATEHAVRTALYAELKAQATAGNKITAPATAAAMSIDQWAALIIDAAELADDRNVALTRLGVSTDVMKALIALKDTGDRYFNVSGIDTSTIGTFDLTGIAGTFLRVPVQILPGAPAGTAAFIDPQAMTVWESGGPTQLTDGSVTQLTNSYSVYGYMAVAATVPDGLIPVEFKA